MSNLRDYETQGSKTPAQTVKDRLLNLQKDERLLVDPSGKGSPEVIKVVDTEHVRALDIQEGGSHYKDMPIQPVEYITANNIPFMEGNVIKYVSRHASKNGAQDIKKAIHFLELILELRYPESKV